MRHTATPYLGVRPEVRPFPLWNLRSEQLSSDPEMHQLVRGLWARHPEPLTALQRAALLQIHLGTPDNSLRITGLSALGLLGLPIGLTSPWINHILRDPPAPRADDFQELLHIPHLSWEGTRIRTCRSDLRITKSYGLQRGPGPWGSLLAHPLEAFVVAAPFLSRWRLIACVDALISHRILVEGRQFLPMFTPESLSEDLELLPPHSRSVKVVTYALRNAQAPTLSPVETLIRLLAVRHGLPRPEMNHPIRVNGRTFYLDLAWPHARVGIEYNGEVHYRNRAQYEDEHHRLHLIRDAAWDVRVLTWSDIRDPARRRDWLDFLARNVHPFANSEVGCPGFRP